MKAAEAAKDDIGGDDGDDDNESQDAPQPRAKRRIRCFSNESEDAEDAVAMADQYLRLGEPDMVDQHDHPATQPPQEFEDVAEPEDFPVDDERDSFENFWFYILTINFDYSFVENYLCKNLTVIKHVSLS